MIAKRIDPRQQGGQPRRDSFKQLSEYIAAAKDEGEKLDQFWMVNFNAGQGIEDHRFAIKEALAVQSKNNRVRGLKNYHLIVSFRDEKPSPEALVEIEQEFAKALGFQEHQRTVATHQNTGNYHMHVAYNKIHPTTFLCHTPSWDFPALEKTCREMEKRFGLKVDLGREDKPEKQRINWKARDYEANTWQESLQSYVLREKEGITAELADAKSWDELHRAFDARGLVVKKRGAGMVIVTHEGDQAVKASSLGREFSAAKLTARFGPYTPPPPELFEARSAAIEPEDQGSRLIKAALANRSFFTRRQLMTHVGKVEKDIDRRTVMLEDLLKRPGLVQLLDADGKEVGWTKTAIVQEERQAVRDAKALANRQARLRPKAIAQARNSRSMRPDQLAAFEAATSGRGFVLIEGRAGVGKSYSAQAIREAWEGSGYRVIGLGPTNEVRASALKDGFKEARTVHSLLMRLKAGTEQLDASSVLMVDEAAMLDNGTMAALLTEARAADATVILIGDDRQLSSVDRGGLFADFREHLGSTEITKITRQAVDWQNQAATHFSNFEFAAGVDLFRANDRLHWSGTSDQARAQLVEQWKQDSAANPKESRFVFAFTNEEVNALNAALRHVRRDRGELGRDELQVKTKHGMATFSVGDRVAITETAKSAEDRARGIINGAMGTVSAVELKTGRLMLQSDDGKVMEIDTTGFEGLRHGYAGTVYKGQGKTLDRTYLLYSKYFRSEPAYVALTRQRKDARLYAAREDARDEAAMVKTMQQSVGKKSSLAGFTPDELEGLKLGRDRMAKETDQPARPERDQPKTRQKQPRNRTRYKRRPIVRHPAVRRLWRRYLKANQRPARRRSGFLFRSFKAWLLTGAISDPLAIALLIHQRAMGRLMLETAAKVMSGGQEAGKGKQGQKGPQQGL